MTGSRRLSRELALQALFQHEFTKLATLKAGLESIRANFEAEGDVWAYAAELLEGIEKHASEIDAQIQKASAHWTLKRMALVDLNIMRVATFELKFTGGAVPHASAINEAIEISKKYGTEDSAAFVNGILDQIVKQ